MEKCKKMRVLFISIPFYEYINKIKLSIERELDADVDLFICNEPLVGSAYWQNKLSKRDIAAEKELLKQTSFFEKVEDDRYDYIFVLVGRGLNKECFENFLERQKTAIKILYLWDDVKRVNEFMWLSALMDRVYSFDDIDCETYGLNFLPLFYCREYLYSNEDKQYDFSFTGFLHTDRERILEEFLNIFPKERYSWYANLKTTRKHIIWKKIKSPSYRKPWYIQYNTIGMDENASVLKKTKVVLDTPHDGQNGLSMRTMEALASNTKIVTTNKNIEKYDFYNDNNIFIIDRKNILVDEKFIKTPYLTNNKQVVAKYSLDNWVKIIFEG